MIKSISLLFITFFISSILYAQVSSIDATDFRPDEKYPTSSVDWFPTVNAAGDWCPGGMFPDIPQVAYFQATAWLGDTLYVQVPTTTGAGSATIFKYTFGGSWSTGVPLPTALVGGTLTACNGKLYYFGGGTTSITLPTTSAYSYDPSTGAWTTVAPLPVALSAQGAVCWGDSVIFIIGGPYTGAATNLDVHYYRVATNSWGTVSNSLPAGQGRRTFACGLADGNKIMIGAGYNTTYLKSVYMGTIGNDATQLTWTQAPDVPTSYAGLSRPGGTAIFKYFFVVGGERAGGGGYEDTAFVFDATSDSWVDVIAPKPLGSSNIFNAVTATAFDDSIRIFVPGGYNGAPYANFDVVACGELLTIPVEISSFTASANYGEVELDWITATETNNQGFEVQRNNGSGFETLAFVEGHGTTTESQAYTYIDKSVGVGVYNYRLRQMDFDGTYEYSNVVEINVPGPTIFAMDQNYPNPFNPSTKISFQLKVDAQVSLKVFDALGQEVATIVNSNLVAGGHSVDFDASALNSGVYFYRIEATGNDGSNFIDVKKMILTK